MNGVDFLEFLHLSVHIVKVKFLLQIYSYLISDFYFKMT